MPGTGGNRGDTPDTVLVLMELVCCHLFICSFIQQILIKSYCVPGSILSTGSIQVNQILTYSLFHTSTAYILQVETDNK
jgi:hypothetical protein